MTQAKKKFERLIGAVDAHLLHLICQICGDILALNHCKCGDCKHYFCSSCISNNDCPNCKSRKLENSKDMIVELEALWIICSNEKCEESFQYSDLELHEQKCNFKMIKCIYCKEIVSQRTHSKEICADTILLDIKETKANIENTKRNSLISSEKGASSNLEDPHYYDKKIEEVRKKLDIVKQQINMIAQENIDQVQTINCFLADRILAKEKQKIELKAQIIMYEDLIKIEFS